MNRDQAIAWLMLEGWEPRRFPGTKGPTLVNIGRGVWFTHWRNGVVDLSAHNMIRDGRRSIGDAVVTSWDALEEAYLDKAIRYIVEGEPK